uniref:Uncharacterized protein n=1 Tax=Pipistrellus kuhlii TaxID=59472 RepID=A0A7J7XAZ5_PIPKU|nr:hypothetical protein mPipKuh1_010632 [Pipistrellus kuhlii]
MSSVFGFGSPAAKNIQQIVYKLNESHYEVLETRHYLCCQTHLLQLFVMSGWGFIILKRRQELFFIEQESYKVAFLIFKKIKDNQICICYLSIQISKTTRDSYFLCCAFVLVLRGRRPGLEKAGCISI